MKKRAAPRGPMTDKEATYLRINACALSHEAMCAHLGWPPRLLRKRLQRLGLTWIKGPRKWSAKEDEILRALAATTADATEIGRRMERDHGSVAKHAARLGVTLQKTRYWSSEEDTRIRTLASAGLTVGQIAKEMGERYTCLWGRVRRLKIKPKSKRQLRTEKPKPPRRERAPRERTGIPELRRIHIAGTVAWCSRCHAPVVDTPQAWAEHNRRVHIAPIHMISEIEAARPCGRAAAVWRIA